MTGQVRSCPLRQDVGFDVVCLTKCNQPARTKSEERNMPPQPVPQLSPYPNRSSLYLPFPLSGRKARKAPHKSSYYLPPLFLCRPECRGKESEGSVTGGASEGCRSERWWPDHPIWPPAHCITLRCHLPHLKDGLPDHRPCAGYGLLSSEPKL